jgi:FSR family fosmidomycin resistance protein-like MFS transporter
MSSAPATERNVLLVTGIAHAATHFAELVYPTLAVVLAADTGLPLDHVLGWSFTGYLLFGLGALPAGLLADHVGARPVLLASLAGMGIGLVLTGLASPGLGVAAGLAVVGLSASAYHPSGMGLITRTISARGRALGVNGIFGNVGIALTPLVTEYAARALGWRNALLVSGGVLIAVTALCASLPIDEPAPPHAAPGAARSSTGGPALVALGVLALCAMLGGISYRGNTLAQPAYFAQRVTAVDFGLATSLVYMFGIVGQYVGGAVADRFPLRWGYLAFHAASLPALLLIGATWNVPLLTAAAVFIFFSLGMQPIENSLFAQLTPDRWRSTGYGLKFILTFGVGSVGVWIVQGVQGRWGLAAVFPVLGGVVFLLVCTIGGLAAVLGRVERTSGARVLAA